MLGRVPLNGEVRGAGVHHFLNGQDIVENLEVINQVGLTRLGEPGTPEDVQSAWKGTFELPWFHVRTAGRLP
ncbi:hypothetical protein GCM10017772_44260 [Promicromonospora soli]|uniref:Uncharacterized protein n=1 Tax=Promicromonospora soli TaxID=2035533 RepID=A0A919L1C5_9MICO|nr:hypothetical protein GCM10017772_44260 [Promicromonospora soli]